MWWSALEGKEGEAQGEAKTRQGRFLLEWEWSDGN